MIQVLHRILRGTRFVFRSEKQQIIHCGWKQSLILAVLLFLNLLTL